jgi:hypothetical protein
MNKRGGFTDIFLFMIISFVLVLFCGIFIFISGEVTDQMQETIANTNLIGDGTNNASVVVSNTMGASNNSFQALYWISIFLIFGMIIAIFIGSFMVTTKPIFFIPFLFLLIIAVIVSVPLSNAYETLRSTAELETTFSSFTGSNWILSNLPMIVVIVGFVGAIIMFVRMGKREEQMYYG